MNKILSVSRYVMLVKIANELRFTRHMSGGLRLPHKHCAWCLVKFGRYSIWSTQEFLSPNHSIYRVPTKVWWSSNNGTSSGSDETWISNWIGCSEVYSGRLAEIRVTWTRFLTVDWKENCTLLEVACLTTKLCTCKMF